MKSLTKDKYGFVYLTTNLINGKKYIGKRKYYTGWEKYLGSGVALKRAIKLYGKENFKKEILCECDNEEELCRKEEYYINLYNAYSSNDFYNISSVSSGGYNINKGKTEEERLAIHKKVSKTRKKLGLSKGEKNVMYGINHTEATKMKMRANHRFNNGGYMDISTKKKISASVQGNKNPNSKAVICITTLERFSFIGEACDRYSNTDKSDIVKCCKFKRKSCGKMKDGTPLKWMYLWDYDEMKNMNMEYDDYIKYKKGETKI